MLSLSSLSCCVSIKRGKGETANAALGELLIAVQLSGAQTGSNSLRRSLQSIITVHYR